MKHWKILSLVLCLLLALSACAPAAQAPQESSAPAESGQPDATAAPQEVLAPEAAPQSPAVPADNGNGWSDLTGLTGEERNEAARQKNEEALVKYAPKRTTLENGVQVQTIPFDNCVWNIGILQADTRGCNTCHNVEDTVQKLPMSHPELWHPYGVEMTVDYCYMCHNAVRTMADSLHALHLRNDKFTETYNGDCLSCHHLDHKTGTFQLWDRVKYDVMTGFTDIANVQGDFSYDQDVLSPEENFFWFWNNGDGRGIQPNYTEPAEDDNMEMFNNWTIEIKGCVEEPVTVTLGQLLRSANPSPRS